MSDSVKAGEKQYSRGNRHPSVLEPATLLVIIVLAIGGALIGMNLITSIGISANTSVIGALLAMIIGRLSFLGFGSLRSIHRQNLIQSGTSAATFSAANSLLAPIAIVFLLGRQDLILPLLVGVSIAVLVDAWVLYRAFGSEFLPATAPWPPGVASAETIKAGDEGGKRAIVLGVGALIGLGGSALSLPMSAAGVAFIGNVIALAMFGLGLLISQYVPVIFEYDLSGAFIPHGVMVGAGLVALMQAMRILLKKRGSVSDENQREQDRPSVTPVALRRALGAGFLLYILGAVVVAFAGSVWQEMSIGATIGWILFAAVAAIVHEIIVGLAAMHSGWFPAFAVTLIFLVVGVLIGFPMIPLALLVGYCSATGPAFADMGYDLKTGWLLRENEKPYARYELEGRKQQFFASCIGFLVSIGMVALLWDTFLGGDRFPPVSKVYADTVQAGISDSQIWVTLALWAIPGAIIQLVGGSSRQMGVMFATGLLVTTPNACWLVFGGLAVRILWTHLRGKRGEEEVTLIGAGIIAGDAIWGTGRVLT